ncbi:BTB/POZ domain-containing protein [Ditylenchus destructor]|uniref:BTB/POZ domain-containing protein n=1 Tax=Ditylenchus destructor TaxID=166010 RepID=A0AAD4MPU7_9BILA|nr:BTB/POZ domain-containing protein [Ditylenchus destructor]
MNLASNTRKRPYEENSNELPVKQENVLEYLPTNVKANSDSEKTALERRIDSHFNALNIRLSKFKNEFQEQLRSNTEQNSREIKISVMSEFVNIKDEMKAINEIVQTLRPKEERLRPKEDVAANTGIHRGTLSLPFIAKELKAEGILRSPKVPIAGASWYISIKVIGNSFILFLCCTPESQEIGYQISGYYSLLHGEKRVAVSFEYFYKKPPVKRIPILQYTFYRLSDHGNELVSHENCTTAQVDFGFKRVLIRSADIDSFLNPMFPSDCVFVVEGHRLHLNKGFLSVHSPYFSELFNEKTADNEYIFDDVSVNEMGQLLSMIYPMKKKNIITKSNIRSMLRVSTRFAVTDVIDKCEEFLINCPTGTPEERLSLSEKLFLSQNYKLNDLKNWCIEQVNTTADFKALQSCQEYKSLDGDILRSILNNVKL